MKKIMVVGAGKIGSLIALMLSQSNKYCVHAVDSSLDSTDLKKTLDSQPQITTAKLDILQKDNLKKYILEQQITTLVSCLPTTLNIQIAEVARDLKINYFDLTEDTTVSATVAKIAQGASSIFVPHCGVAPGFINTLAANLINSFESCHTVKLRVGALPQKSTNTLGYALTWSTDGLINEYINRCFALENGKKIEKPALGDLESIQIEGTKFEAFSTSGGVGTLIDSYAGEVKKIDYKTIRYPGHCDKMNFLLNELNLRNKRETLKELLESSLPRTYDDLVLLYVTATGTVDNKLIEKNYFKKIYPQEICNIKWSAIQVATACGVCAAIDVAVSDSDKFKKGLIRQEQFSLNELLDSHFGIYLTA